ncbi:hypothetical protein ASA1KI_27390 [Opitutales bacterium ASA1]|uniref:RNA polymerase sigma factor n=1 Tax=Congregicoccus parvus TaxID=3081749 RepID=UPI002B2AC3C8|nr:hypothetical protein ASA1KI_27390 [Opitutales bacterium ASA1]
MPTSTARTTHFLAGPWLLASSRAANGADEEAPCDDARLVERARAGELEALDVLVLRHREAITRRLWRFAVDREDLQDLVQDTFVRTIRALGTWEARQPFAHWVLRIASNVGRDYFRRRAVRRRHLVDTEADEGAGAHEALDPGSDPAARAAANEIKLLLDRLPPDDRALLALHHLEGLSLGEIAEQYGWTPAGAKLRAWRARRRLRAMLSTRYDHDEESHGA